MITKKNKSKKKPLIIITAGGTGGHVYPAESLAEELSSRGYELALVTDSRGKNNYRGKLGEIQNYAVQAGALIGKSYLFKIKSLFKTGIGIAQAIAFLVIKKPICVVGFGGYASFPCSAASILLGIPLIIHEQNSVMSRTNRFLSRFAKLTAQSFKNVKSTPQEAKTVLTGMPIRKNIIDIRDRTYPKAEKQFRLLILGGSQGSKIFSEVIPEAIKKCDKKTIKMLKIYQQCRQDDLKAANKAYLGSEADITLTNFFNNMPKLYSESHLIISRAGASSVSEIAAVGLPSILVPLAIAADDHQTYNAKNLEDTEAAIIIKESDFTPDTLHKALSRLIGDHALLKKMANNAKKAGIIDAATRLADAIEKEIRNVRIK